MQMYKKKLKSDVQQMIIRTFLYNFAHCEVTRDFDTDLQY